MRKADDHDLLTQREIQILKLVAQGFSAKEVAQTIEIAPRTVEGYIDMIRLKLHARNRTHMVTKAIAARLITIDFGADGENSGAPKGATFLYGPERTVLDVALEGEFDAESDRRFGLTSTVPPSHNLSC
ncbi:hypothetical protein A0J57_08900 [Sphingobium sp. 22B]|uniref:response regulator transcription factor n=1 Tax=unclassified Sphingobium TaxID=2611147 RepID=UPI00078650FE|nr:MULTISPECIES: helix-turn-helix transcriptional regulator [unclassified Sphingobium]KXU32657.1 hypothetical protein AXW74_06390 [Sphingobium sp. AM]KYC32734.1 hypothetical protein A0J57_08900 [Sphingobium sp. 22B]OAP31623.1 hypothetical protein A8O16_12355 [Sphingobium sp. 20006FA]